MPMLDLFSRTFAGKHPNDAARVLERLPSPEAAHYLESNASDIASAIFASISLGFAVSCMTHMQEGTCALFLRSMPLPQVTARLLRLEREKQIKILELLPKKMARRLETALAVPEGYVAGAIDSSVVVVTGNMSAAEAARHARETGDRLEDFIFVVDEEDRLIGVMNARELLLCEPEQKVETIMNRNIISLPLRTSLAAVANHRAWQRFQILPVVDRDGTFQGILRSDRLTTGIAKIDSSRELQGSFDAMLVLAFALWTSIADFTISALSKKSQLSGR